MGELKEAGISHKESLYSGLNVDMRRRTVHDENVKSLKKKLREFTSKPKKTS